MLKVIQKEFSLGPYRRGLHNITEELAPLLGELPQTGMVNLFLRHTSAGLTINENTDPDVLRDLEDALDAAAPEGAPWRHDDEGPDDMPAHIKSTLTGVSLTIPIADGRLALGTWQGIFLCEFRDHALQRRITATVAGDF